MSNDYMSLERAKSIIARGEPHPRFESHLVDEYHRVLGFLEGYTQRAVDKGDLGDLEKWDE